jgi:hypothetical protein
MLCQNPIMDDAGYTVQTALKRRLPGDGGVSVLNRCGRQNCISFQSLLTLHTWGSALTHHPHVYGIVPGGGLSADGGRWIACRRGLFLPVRVLSRLFRRRFLDALGAAHRAGQLHWSTADISALRGSPGPM